MRMGGVVALVCLAACGGGSGDDDDVVDAEWATITEERDSSLLSVWGESADDVWVVGGRPFVGTGPTILHLSEGAWDEVDSGEININLWWVFGFAGGPVFFTGDDGAILRYEGGAIERMDTPGNATVFGLWGASPDDLWAVGGIAGSSAFVWRYDGEAWTDVALSDELANGGTVWKVNGRGADDVWMSGTTGALLHWDGEALDEQFLPIDDSLFSVACMTDGCVSVGGAFDGVVYELDGTTWTSAIDRGGPVMRGVAAAPAGTAFGVGAQGAILRRDDDGWVAEEQTATFEDLHAAWIDPDGGLWAVGGQFDQLDTILGTLIYRGPATSAPPVLD